MQSQGGDREYTTNIEISHDYGECLVISKMQGSKLWEEVGAPEDPNIDMHKDGRFRNGDDEEQVQNGCGSGLASVGSLQDPTRFPRYTKRFQRERRMVSEEGIIHKKQWLLTADAVLGGR